MIDEKKLAKASMSDEELEQVSGGGTRQTGGDNDFLKYFGYNHFDGTILWDIGWDPASKAVDKGWSEAGITCVTKYGAGDNQYYLDGKRISRMEAFRHVLKQKGWNEAAINSYNFDQWAGSF